MPAAWSALVAHYKSKCNLATDAEAEDRIRIDIASGNGGIAGGSSPASAQAPASAAKPAPTLKAVLVGKSAPAMKPVPTEKPASSAKLGPAVKSNPAAKPASAAKPGPVVKPIHKPAAVVASRKLKPIDASSVKGHVSVPSIVVAPRAQHGSSSKLPPLSVPASSADRHDTSPSAFLSSQRKDAINEANTVQDDQNSEVLAVTAVSSTLERADTHTTLPSGTRNSTSSPENTEDIEKGILSYSSCMCDLHLS